MTFVIAEPCIDVLDQACVNVCPVACIHFDPGKDRKLYIDPDECIDCAACEPVCPVEAIYADDELPEKWAHYAEWNTYLSKQWSEADKVITEKKVPLPDAEEWKDREKTEQDIMTWETA